MNQILSVENKAGKEKKDIKGIIKVFGIVLIVFAVLLIGIGGYKFVTDNNLINSVAGDKKPEVSIEKQDENIVISAKYSKELTKIIYSWNNGEEETINGNGTNKLEGTIELLEGSNTLNVKIVDISGNETSFEKSFVTESTKPQISIETAGNNLKIIAKDNSALSYITYRWDEEEETKITVTEDSKAQIEKEIEMRRGQHILTVIAVNENNETETKTQEVKGITKPKVSVIQDGQYLVITATDEEAMKEITYTLNGKKYKIDYSTVREKTIEYKQAMQEGENRISLTATNFDDAKETFEGICTYTP